MNKIIREFGRLNAKWKKSGNGWFNRNIERYFEDNKDFLYENYKGFCCFTLVPTPDGVGCYDYTTDRNDYGKLKGK